MSVVVPAYNESASIGPLVSGLRLAGSWREIIVVDDGSNDDTGARAAEAGARGFAQAREAARLLATDHSIDLGLGRVTAGELRQIYYHGEPAR